MSTMFERFAKMAKEEFGYTVVKSTEPNPTTFESLFGVSAEAIAQYELPYNVSLEQFGYYDEAASLTMIVGVDMPANDFNTNDFVNLAA